MKSTRASSFFRLTVLAIGITLPALSHAQTTGWNKTAVGTYDYNDTANWVDGMINGIWDASLTLTGAQTIQFSADTILSTALDFECFGSQNITLNGTGGAKTITLGGDITSNISTNKALTIGSTTAANNLNVDLGGVTRTFTVGSSKILTLINVISNGGVIVGGATNGVVNFSGVNTYSGATTVNAGFLRFNTSTASAANSDITANVGTTVQFQSSGSSVTRAKTVTLKGATLTGAGTSGGNSVDGIFGALAIGSGGSTVTLTAHASFNERLNAASFSRGAGGSVLFSGTSLGVNDISSSTANSTNISFTTAPTLNQAGSGTTIGIIAGAYGDTTSAGVGFGATGGLVTYDEAKGVRLLNTATEYTASIGDGQTASDNVRYTAPTTTTLTSTTTTINSLSFDTSGAAGTQGITITGDAGTTLKLNSGVIYADFNSIAGTPVAADSITISVPTLDLDAKEAIVLVSTGGASNQGNYPARLYITGVITNGSLTKSGPGQLQLGGSVSNTYTGVTTVNAGTFQLAKTGGATAIAGDVVVNGGNLFQDSNQIADTSNVTVNGGQWRLGTSNSGASPKAETVATLTVNGGIAYGGNGSPGTNTLTVTGAVAVANTGQILSATGYNFNFGSLAVGTGGTVTQASANNITGGIMTVNGALALTHAASGAYTPITLAAGAARGGTLLLSGDVTSTGNATNTITMTINAAAGTVLGTIDLNGGTRTFTVGNGVAAVDLTITPEIKNGGLTKTGLGTLALTGTNTYTGATTVTTGTLSVSGSIASSATTVGNGATLALSGSGIAGAVTVNSGGAFQLGTAGTAGAVAINSGTFGGVGTVNSLTFTGASVFGPGNSPGTVTIADGGSLTLSSGTTSTFQFTDSGFGVGTFDLVTTPSTGTGTIAGILNLDFTGSGYTAGTSVTFINLSSITGTFSAVNITGLSGLTANVNYNDATGDVSLTLATTAIPEPSTYALLGGFGALLFALGYRRRARKASTA
ncbi:MAG: autotransporter-associated beta strand repeat-containing protein [Opitutaceae bacterium]|jgi:autotransporter-associated beta strand protein